MPGKSRSTQAGEEQQGSSGHNVCRQEQRPRNPDMSNARDREGHKGRDSAKNL